GRGHHLLPSEIPFRANIHALKQLGVKYLISASAVGSLKEAIKPLDMVVPDQFIDRTRHRESTFFGDGIVAHIAFGNPVCSQLAQYLSTAIADLGLPNVTLHENGTYVCMEGPAFSTIAESNLYRDWGGSVIGMTNLPEAKLAREAEIAYATLALVTDYDCWHEDHDHVTVEMVIDNLQRNAVNAQKVILETVKKIQATPFQSPAHSALQYAILTPREHFPPATQQKLALLLDKYR
ncbi:MAG: S-methyl-5'-thioadenosine phosphorylase, partial [Synechocystis sp.]|nr:S-methyl-5'-thioadenosine phosphorylase [Synechocystis sp.]